jgi:AraC-like DNA-binding protein
MGVHMVEFKALQLQKVFSIREIMSFYYIELSSDFSFPAEEHDFWEFIYVDKGEIQVETHSGVHLLSPGHIIFHEPHEGHVGRAIHRSAPNLIVLAFSCDAPCLSFFKGKVCQLNENERDILIKLVLEGTRAFSPPIDSPRIQHLERRYPAPFASEQAICNYLEIFLILLMRRDDPLSAEDRNKSVMPMLSRQDTRLDLINQIIGYLHQHVDGHLSIDQLCQIFYTSRSYLMDTFKLRTEYSLMEYFSLLKIDRSKTLIRAGNQTLTQIADQLSYKDLGTFSRQFKKVTGMSPTEYRHLIKS